MVTATFIRDISTGRPDVSRKLWRLSKPVPLYDGSNGPVTQYVVTSATVVMFSGPETYILPSNAEGKVTDWLEMSGSFKGGLDHERAIREAGWANHEPIGF